MSIHISDSVSDRGKSKYFHGRKNVLTSFNRHIGYANKHRSGAIFLIQGPPGSGKTALLFEASKQAKKKGWGVFDIEADGLWDLTQLKKYTKSEKKISVSEAHVDLKLLNFNLESAEESILDFIDSGEGPLLLVLDEAQTLNRTTKPPERHLNTITKVLNRIENGKFNRPIMLLVGGLGTTKKAFQSLGISRFKKNCVFHIGSLDEISERNMIRDWLVYDGQAKGSVDDWIDEISKETYGYPQHVMSYVDVAIDTLKKTNGKLTDQCLQKTLLMGRKDRYSFYEDRSELLLHKERRNIANLFSSVAPHEAISFDEIITSLQKDFPLEKAEKIFDTALEKGVLSQKGAKFMIPIPSMHDWLVNNFSVKEANASVCRNQS